MVSKIKLLLLATLGLITLALPMSPVVMAISDPVEFIIPDTTLKVAGFASPGALVSIYDNNTLIGTAVAGTNARYSKSFVALDSGLHNLTVEYVDKAGRKSAKVTNTVSLAFHKETAVEYFFAPTFEIVPTAVVQGDIVTFRGSSVPGASIKVTVDGGNTVLNPRVDNSGNYSISLATDGFFFGRHPATAIAKFGGNTSYQADASSFEVIPSPESYNPEDHEADLQPPVITSPESPYSTDDPNLLVRGTAAPNQQIIVFVDGEPIGSTFTNSEGQWFFNIQLFRKNHQIQAITCVDSECSGFSNNLRIEFTGDLGRCKDTSFSMVDYRYWNIKTNSGIDLSIAQLNGQPPYEVAIDWGDGVTELFNNAQQKNFSVHHIYQDPGQFNGNITINDDLDCSYSRYFSVDVTPGDMSAVDYWWAFPAVLTVGFAYSLRRREKK